MEVIRPEAAVRVTAAASGMEIPAAAAGSPSSGLGEESASRLEAAYHHHQRDSASLHTGPAAASSSSSVPSTQHTFVDLGEGTIPPPPPPPPEVPEAVGVPEEGERRLRASHDSLGPSPHSRGDSGLVVPDDEEWLGATLRDAYADLDLAAVIPDSVPGEEGLGENAVMSAWRAAPHVARPYLVSPGRASRRRGSTPAAAEGALPEVPELTQAQEGGGGEEGRGWEGEEPPARWLGGGGDDPYHR